MSQPETPESSSDGVPVNGVGLSRAIETSIRAIESTRSLVAGVDTSWLTKFNTSYLSAIEPSILALEASRPILAAIDTSWLTKINTSYFNAIEPSILALEASRSILAGIDTSWLTKINTSYLSAIEPSILALEASRSILAGIDTSWLTKINTSYFNAIEPAIRALEVSRSILAGIDTSWITMIDTSWLTRIDTSWIRELGDPISWRVRGLPSNWSGVSVASAFDDEILKSIVLAEGIPLAWVPSSNLLERLLTASGARERRELLRNGWRGVLRDCEKAVGELPSRRGRDHARYVVRAAVAIRDGHHEAAQALAANLVDTLGRTYVTPHLVGHKWSLVTATNQRPKLSKLDLRTLLVLAPLAAGYASYNPGDSIPRTFTRNATSHGVSRRQYTKVNSLIALMNATAFLCWLERDSDAFVES